MPCAYRRKTRRNKGQGTKDSATAHTVEDSLTALEGVFCDRIISRSLWPAHSPDLTPYDFHLWDNLKDKVCRTNPQTEEELNEKIRREILEVPQEELLRMNFNLFKRYRVCACTGTSFSALLITQVS
jgi:hypothetical protein